MQKAKIIALSVLAAVAYGVMHDQITARLCVEYFTIAHPPLFHTESPTMLGLGWGVAATAWVGLILGVLLAEVSQSAGAVPVPIGRLLKLILGLLAVMAASASLAGVLGFALSRRGLISLPAAFVELVPSYKHERFMAVWFAHGASYLVGVLGSVVLIGRIWYQRGRPRVLSVLPHTKPEIIRAFILGLVIAGIVYLRFTRH